MRVHVQTAAAVSILAGILVGCSSTTTGTLARTTEPGPPLTSRSPTSSARPSATALPPLPSELIPTPHRPTVPAPANSSTMTCTDYTKLDDETKLAVVDAIMASEPKSLYNDNLVPMFQALADAMCDVLPSATVRDVVVPK